jgi:hypothetical protein
MSCEYCNIKKYDDRSWNDTKVLQLDYGDYTALSMVYHCRDKSFGIMAEGEGRAEIMINYCPMCGRKLS